MLKSPTSINTPQKRNGNKFLLRYRKIFQKRGLFFLAARIQRSIGEERAALSKEYCQSASNTNRIVAARAQDVDYVLNNVSEMPGAIPELLGFDPMYFGVPQSRQRMIFIGVREDLWNCIQGNLTKPQP